jgi:hypothetical protein
VLKFALPPSTRGRLQWLAYWATWELTGLKRQLKYLPKLSVLPKEDLRLIQLLVDLARIANELMAWVPPPARVECPRTADLSTGDISRPGDDPRKSVPGKSPESIPDQEANVGHQNGPAQ